VRTAKRCKRLPRSTGEWAWEEEEVLLEAARRVGKWSPHVCAGGWRRWFAGPGLAQKPRLGLGLVGLRLVQTSSRALVDGSGRARA
jgi:hypothetical protein